MNYLIERAYKGYVKLAVKALPISRVAPEAADRFSKALSWKRLWRMAYRSVVVNLMISWGIW